jgi:hypothetical protein
MNFIVRQVGQSTRGDEVRSFRQAVVRLGRRPDHDIACDSVKLTSSRVTRRDRRADAGTKVYQYQSKTRDVRAAQASEITMPKTHQWRTRKSTDRELLPTRPRRFGP